MWEAIAVTDKQKNCSYCHVNKDSEEWGEDGLCFKQITDDPNVYVGYNTWGDISFDPVGCTLTSWGEGTDPLIIDVKYCPMCGRKLEVK